MLVIHSGLVLLLCFVHIMRRKLEPYHLWIVYFFLSNHDTARTLDVVECHGCIFMEKKKRIIDAMYVYTFNYFVKNI